MCLKFILTESPRKKASQILPALQIDNKSSLKLGLDENHNATLESTYLSSLWTPWQ